MRNLIDINLFLLLQYIFITFILMSLYQGGSVAHPNASSYIVSENYLSDLGRTVLFDHENNPFWMFYTFTLALVGMGTFLFFFILAQLQTSKKYIPIILGLISGLGYVGIAFFQVNQRLKAHLIAGQIAYFAFFLGLISLLVYINKPVYKKIYIFIFVLAILIAVYLLIGFLGPNSSDHIHALHFKTLTQKISVYSQIGISIAILLQVKKTVYHS